MSEVDITSATASTGDLKRAASDYLGVPIAATDEIALALRDVLVVAREERAMLEKIRTEAEGSLGKPTFRVLDRILLILRGKA